MLTKSQQTAKNKKPIIPFNERMDIVEAIKFVDEVVPQTNYDKMEAWNNLKFDLMFVGDDWKGTEKECIVRKGLGVTLAVEWAFYSCPKWSQIGHFWSFWDNFGGCEVLQVHSIQSIVFLPNITLVPSLA